MEEKGTFISGGEVKRRLRRRMVMEIVMRCLAVAELILLCVFALGSRPPVVKILTVVLGFATFALIFLSGISSSDRARVCAHCGTRHKYKTLLSQPEEEFLCPHCGKVYQAKVVPGEFRF